MAKKSPRQKTTYVVERNRFQRWPITRLIAALEDSKRQLQEMKKADPNWRLWGIWQPGLIEDQARRLQAEIQAMELERIRRRPDPAGRAPFESTSAQPSIVSSFRYSEDFRFISFVGASYNLTSRQAQVIQLL